MENATFSTLSATTTNEKFEPQSVHNQGNRIYQHEVRRGNGYTEMKDQYYNMREQVEPVFHIVETAVKAMEVRWGETPLTSPYGGTDRHAYRMGLPCPNLFAGGETFMASMSTLPWKHGENHGGNA